MFKSTAIYPNRIEDKLELEEKLSLQEEGNSETEFCLPDKSLFAKGYTRIVYGDHGPYLEFNSSQIKCSLNSKYGNKFDINNLPNVGYKYYYLWLYPNTFRDFKIYFQIKPVTNLPNAPKRTDGKKSNFNRIEGYADYQKGLFYVDPYTFLPNTGSYIQDPRKTALKLGLSQLTVEQLKRVINYPGEMLLDTYNYQDGKFCPLAIGLELDQNMVGPSHDKVFGYLTLLGYKVNNTKGVKGNFYTNNRLQDLLEAAQEVIKEKENNIQ